MIYDITIQAKAGDGQTTTFALTNESDLGVALGSAIRALDYYIARPSAIVAKVVTSVVGPTEPDFFPGYRDAVSRLFEAAKEITTGWEASDAKGRKKRAAP